MSWLDYVNPIVGVAESGFNVGTQLWNMAYQKKLNETLMHREDTAVQRRAADLKAAGLSKTLAAGSAASSSAGSVTQPAQMSLLDRISAALSMKRQEADIKNVEADTANKLITGESITQEIQNKKAQEAYIIAQTALAGKNVEYLGARTDQVNQLIEKSKIEVEHEMLKMGYTQAQIDEAKSRKNYVEAQTETQRQYSSLLVEKVTAQIYANDMAAMENIYTLNLGKKMPSGDSGLIGLFDRGVWQLDQLLGVNTIAGYIENGGFGR